MFLRQPSDHLVPRADREALTGQQTADDEQRGQGDAGAEHPQRHRTVRDRLGVPDQAGEGACADRTADPDEDRAGEVAVLERGAPLVLEREDGVGVAQRDEHQVARCARHQCRKEHPSRHLVTERHLEREDRSGRRRLEDRRHTGCCASDEQRAVIDATERRRESTLDHRAERRPAVHRRTLESHRPARAERRDRGGHAPDERPRSQRVLRIVERPEILVRGGRRRTIAEGVEQDRRQHQADSGSDRTDPQGPLHDPFEHDLDHDVLEEPDEQSGECSRDRGQQHDLAGTSHQVTELAGANVEAGWAPPHVDPAAPHDDSV